MRTCFVSQPKVGPRVTAALVCLLWVHCAIAQPVSRLECAKAPPGTVFCEDFEGTNPKANFNDYDGNADSENQVVVETGPGGDSQNRAIRLRVPSMQRGGSDLVKVLPGRYDRLFARWYFKYESGFNFAAPNHGGGLAAGDRSFLGQSGNRPAGNDFAGFYVQYQDPTSKPFAYSYYRGMYQDCANAQGSCWGDALPCVYDDGRAYCTKPQHRPSAALPALKAGQWYCVEQMVDMGAPSSDGAAPNGRLTLWLDGQQIGDFSDLWIRTVSTLQLQTLWISLFHHDGTHSDAGEFVDNIVVSTQRIGCGANGGASALPAPTGLRIVQ